MLDTWSLQVLVEVADQGSFSAAAQELSMTQPAVSRQVASLERKLGVGLFRRVPRGVEPTAAGAIAIEEARNVLDRLGTLQARMEAFADLRTGHVRISSFPSANTDFVPAAIRRFRDLYPGVEVSLVQGDVAGIRAGDVDLAMLTTWDTAPEEVVTVPLLDEEHWVALSEAHPLASLTTVPLRQLRADSWVEGSHPDCLGPLDILAEALGGPPRVGFTCEDWTGKQALVAAGMGVTIISTLAAAALRPGVVLRPTAPRLPSRGVLAATAPSQARSPATTAMLRVLTDLGASYR
ncbi:LysR family transcriptional regulator [Jiangella endophytica]|uniref:LysR family transcriptional regulator n=1 Tax=Jiangella endophytica TaxID=1623398 RepID=UPI0018E50633|nr:LysR family transcriptional regulator [Jiangella endophytica]